MTASSRWLYCVLITVAACLSLRVASAAPGVIESPTFDVDPKSEVRELGHGARLILAPGSALRETSPVSLPDGSGGRIQAVSLSLEAGRLDIVIPKNAQGKRAVVVKFARRATAILQYGHSALAATEECAGAATYTGQMTVSVGAAWLNLSAGKRWLWKADGSQGGISPLLGPPVVSLPARILVAMPGPGRPLEVDLSPPAPASRYQVIVRSAEDSGAVTKRFESATPTVGVEGLRPGTYLLEARAVDTFGLEGQPTTPLELRVVGVELPSGAYLRRGVPQLGHRQRIRLTNADGLEMTYGAGEYFVPAPADISLNHGRAVLIRLRLPNQPGEARFELEPRQLMTSILIGPANAVWPRDEVKARVTLRERAGDALDFKELGMTPSATLNNQPLSLGWTCGNGECSSEVPRPKSPGPWVLRVELRDAEGEVLHHAFLEIADGTHHEALRAR